MLLFVFTTGVVSQRAKIFNKVFKGTFKAGQTPLSLIASTLQTTADIKRDRDRVGVLLNPGLQRKNPSTLGSH